LKPQIPLISQIKGERNTVYADCISVPDAFLAADNAKLVGFNHLRNL
jgi:hypothetical protein